MEKLKAQIFQEIPDQVLEYYKMIGAKQEDIQKKQNQFPIEIITQGNDVRDIMVNHKLSTVSTLQTGNTQITNLPSFNRMLL